MAAVARQRIGLWQRFGFRRRLRLGERLGLELWLWRPALAVIGPTMASTSVPSASTTINRLPSA